MLERLHQQRAAIAAVLNDETVTSPRKAVALEISQQEWTTMGQLTEVLRPLQIATTTLNAEMRVTASATMPVISSVIEKHLKENSERDSDTVKRVKTLVRDDLSRRFRMRSVDLNLAESPLVLASFLDPRFKNLSFLSEDDRLNTYTIVNSEIPIDASGTVNKRQRSQSALDILLGDEEEDEEVPQGVAEFQKYKMEQHLDRNGEPLEWWRQNDKRYPNLAQLAKKYLGIPATSAPCERVFSTSGNVVTEKRSRLDPENVRNLVFLNYNLKLRQRIEATLQTL